MQGAGAADYYYDLVTSPYNNVRLGNLSFFLSFFLFFFFFFQKSYVSPSLEKRT
jgi:hypothetical protein